MGQFTVEISPRELMTHYRNKLQVAVGSSAPVSMKEVALSAECRLMAGGRVKEQYLLAEKRFSGGDLPGGSPVRLEWEVEIARKGPLSFKNDAFSIEHCAIVEVTAEGTPKERFEVPLTVVPGRIASTEVPADR
ncbi:MAG: hypothetical protein RDV48_09135 [Candidatus Eremiobacteraeota bacterium]|nr:hypothetical protein [Candidatus Eremiobacteraeota bacterium]